MRNGILKLFLIGLTIVSKFLLVEVNGQSAESSTNDFEKPLTTGRDLSQLPVIALSSEETQEIPSWLCLGPFLQKVYPTISFPEDAFKKTFGIQESALSQDGLKNSIEELRRRSQSGINPIHARLAEGPADVMYFTDALGLSDLQAEGESRTVYAACVINSNQECDRALFTGSDDCLSLWLNGKLILDHQGRRQQQKFREVSYVHFQKGSNFVFVKVVGLGNGLGFWAAVGKDWKNSVQRVSDSWNLMLCNRWAACAGETIVLNLPIYGIPEPLIYLKKGNNTLIRLKSGKNFIPPLFFGSGVAYVVTEVSDIKMEQPIFLGDPVVATKRYREEYERLYPKSPKEDLLAACKRCEHLIKKEHYDPTNPNWQLKFTTQAALIERAISNTESGQDPFKGRTGSFFHAYRSEIDGSIQYCLVYVPHKCSRETALTPIVLLAPVESDPVRPFLESVFAADGADWAIFRTAEQYGFAVVLPMGRGNSYGMPIGLNDMMESLHSMYSVLPIDKDRQFVQGWCSSGMFALMLGSFFPDEFCGIGLTTPITIRDKNLHPVGFEQIPITADKSWLTANNPYNFCENTADIPILLQYHDLEEEEHRAPGFEYDRRAFVERRKALGMTTQVQKFRRPGYYRFDEYDAFFRWCVDQNKRKLLSKSIFSAAQTKYGMGNGLSIEKQKSPIIPSRIEAEIVDGTRIEFNTWNVDEFSFDFKRFGFSPSNIPKLVVDQKEVRESVSTGKWMRILLPGDSYSSTAKSNGLEGPIAHCLARPFIVTADSGIGANADAARSWCEKFRARWRKDFFCDCRYKSKSELTVEDWKWFDVLIFTSNIHSLPQACNVEKRISISETSVVVGGKQVSGTNLGLIAVWRNPVFCDHYVAVATSNNFEGCDFPDANFAFEGWFDFLVWKTEGSGRCEVLQAGSFNREWQ